MPSPRDITLRDFLIEAMAAAVDRPGFTATRNANGYPRSADAIIPALKTEDSEWQVVRRVSTTTIAEVIYEEMDMSGSVAANSKLAARAVQNLLTKETT